MHAIYRQNFGFTDIIIGRKHADAPYHDGTPIWGDFDAQEIFNHLAGDLRIAPLRVGFAAYYESVGRVDLMENHPTRSRVFISGKDDSQGPGRGAAGRSADHAREHGGDSARGHGAEVAGPPTSLPVLLLRQRIAARALAEIAETLALLAMLLERGQQGRERGDDPFQGHAFLVEEAQAAAEAVAAEVDGVAAGGPAHQAKFGAVRAASSRWRSR